jgi:hypothetical protein
MQHLAARKDHFVDFLCTSEVSGPNFNTETLTEDSSSFALSSFKFRHSVTYWTATVAFQVILNNNSLFLITLSFDNNNNNIVEGGTYAEDLHSCYRAS